MVIKNIPRYLTSRIFITLIIKFIYRPYFVCLVTMTSSVYFPPLLVTVLCCFYFLMNIYIFIKSKIKTIRYLEFVNDRNCPMKHQQE